MTVMANKEKWITKYCAFLVQHCDMTLKTALKEAQDTWDKAQFKFSLGDTCVTDDNFIVKIVDMVFEDDTAYYICKPLEFDCPIERSYIAEQLTLRSIVRDTKVNKYWCVDVRKFDSKRIKAITYPVYAETKPEDTDIDNKMCEQHRYYVDSYEEAKHLKRGYDSVNAMRAESLERKLK